VFTFFVIIPGGARIGSGQLIVDSGATVTAGGLVIQNGGETVTGGGFAVHDGAAKVGTYSITKAVMRGSIITTSYGGTMLTAGTSTLRLLVVLIVATVLLMCASWRLFQLRRHRTSLI
jgi:hypothetical protein